nr:hypothetical protein [Nocardioides lijunqiniae]
MTCPSATRCLVGDAGGHLWRLNPSEDLNDWYEVPVAGFPQDTARSRIFDIDCSADDVCVAVSSGYLIAQAPGLDEEWWNGAVAQASGRRPTTYQGVACAGTTFCLAADVTGELVAGTVNHAPLSVVKTGTGTGTVTSDLPGIDCGTTCTDSDVPVGAVVVLTATPDSDSELLGWGDDVDCGTDPECEVTVKDGGTIVTPRFRRPRSLKVQILGGSSVQGADGAFPCWSSCESTYDDGEVVTLTATPDPGSTFSYWTGGCTGSANPCVVTMDADKIVRAHFDVPPTTPPATAAPVIRAAGVAPKSVARGKRVTFSVTSSARGVTRVLVGKPTVGRMVAGVCKPKTAKNKAKKKCTYTRVVTTLSSTQSAGRTAIAYRTKKLVPGTYRATITVTGTTGLVSRPKVLTFRVRKR